MIESILINVCKAPITSIMATSDHAAILTSTLDSTLRLMDKNNGELLKAYKSDQYVNTKYRIRSTITSEDGQVLAGSENGKIVAWDLMSAANVATVIYEKEKKGSSIASKRDIVSAVAWCPTRPEWCSAGGDGNVVVWSR